MLEITKIKLPANAPLLTTGEREEIHHGDTEARRAGDEDIDVLGLVDSVGIEPQIRQLLIGGNRALTTETRRHGEGEGDGIGQEFSSVSPCLRGEQLFRDKDYRNKYYLCK